MRNVITVCGRSFTWEHVGKNEDGDTAIEFYHADGSLYCVVRDYCATVEDLIGLFTADEQEQYETATRKAIVIEMNRVALPVVSAPAPKPIIARKCEVRTIAYRLDGSEWKQLGNRSKRKADVIVTTVDETFVKLILTNGADDNHKGTQFRVQHRVAGPLASAYVNDLSGKRNAIPSALGTYLVEFTY